VVTVGEEERERERVFLQVGPTAFVTQHESHFFSIERERERENC
jgi:hypothetical protein